MIMRIRNFTLLAFFVLLLPKTVFAHPGHGTSDGVNLLHYLSSPLHLIISLVVVTLILVGLHHLRKKLSN
jgi:hypothetical protein